MKNTLFIALSTLVLVSCGSAEDVIEEVGAELNLPERIASGRAKAFAYSVDKTDSTLSQIDYVYYTPQFSSGVMDSTFKDSVNARIVHWASMQSPETETLLLGPLTDYYFERVVNDFTMDETSDPDTEGMYRWSLEMSFDIHESDNYVCLNSGMWSYTGGAHGNGASLYEYFSKETGERFGLEYFAQNMAMLLEISERHFREQQEIEPGMSVADAGFWFEDDAFHLTDNFYFTDDNIVFVFNAYDIAPYAAGAIELVVPLDELNGIITQ